MNNLGFLYTWLRRLPWKIIKKLNQWRRMIWHSKLQQLMMKRKKGEDEDLDLIPKKFMKYIKFKKIKGRRFHSKKKSSSFKKKKKKTNDGNMKWRVMRTPRKKSTQMCANMCFIALEDNKDKVISSSNYDELKKMLLTNYTLILRNLGCKKSLLKVNFPLFKMSSMSLKKILTIVGI